MRSKVRSNMARIVASFLETQYVDIVVIDVLETQ